MADRVAEDLSREAFEEIIATAFSPYLLASGFSCSPLRTSGRLYLAEFTSPNHKISVSFEPFDGGARLQVFSLDQGSVQDIDDPAVSPLLSDLNAKYASRVSAADRDRVDTELAAIQTSSAGAVHLVKLARELRLVLPLHLRDSGVGSCS